MKSDARKHTMPSSSTSSTFTSKFASTSTMLPMLKLVVAAAFLLSAVHTVIAGDVPTNADAEATMEAEDANELHRRLSAVGDSVPKYMDSAMKDLRARQKLFEETPPEEVKYWFEYSGELQKYFYRFSKSRAKADYFEGRDDSGVTSSRFIEDAGGTPEFTKFYTHDWKGDAEKAQFQRLLENCLSMGSPSTPDSEWNSWFPKGESHADIADRCRILFTLNTVGAGRGTTILWETNPPKPHAQGPEPWMSEQETAATHLARNLEEIDHMCETGLIAARVQVLVCEPISARWTEWMDSKLPHCGGKSTNIDKIVAGQVQVEERPSPVQVVVVSSASTADTCHDLKSGFMEKRMQDLILAPPYLGDGSSSASTKSKDPSVKTTHKDLVSSDDYDLYVGLKWTSLVTIRAINSFLQASADLAAAANSPVNQKASTAQTNVDGVTVAINNSPASPFLIPSFVRMSYVSEENSKVAKWRMHGDFFHPAAWEICKDSFEMTWIDHSLSGSGSVKGICYEGEESTDVQRRLKASGGDCGQWWIYMSELQMPTSPEVYANEVTPALVQGGSNFIWMLTERQRREIVKRQVCLHENKETEHATKCPSPPQAVIPLGDMESFLINFTPNTALGKKHVHARRPGYSREKQREAEREKVRERKQLKGQDDIEQALFDYTIYPAALFRKDATIKATRARDLILTPADQRDDDKIGPQTIKSSYYDVTITKPRPPVLGWCQAIARSGLCTLYADYFRTSTDARCMEACGMKRNWSPIDFKSD